MKKKIISVILATLLLCALMPAAQGATVTAREAIDTLTTLGLVEGTGSGFEPEQALTRVQAVVMLVRLLGCEAEAQQAALDPVFSDVPDWAAASVGWAREQGLVSGRSEYWLGAGETAQVRDYLTFVLRALDYREGEDFRWAEAVAFADSIGLTHGEYERDAQLLREDMALISYTALTLKCRNSEYTLVEQLYQKGAISYEQLKQTRLAGYCNSGKQTLEPREIYERASSSVFYLEVFETEQQKTLGTASGTGSGFFISDDGLAVMSYHELDGGTYAIATLSDGSRYSLERVLYYDPMRDIALVQISKTALDGSSVRFFPYLEIGDSDAISNGDVVYTLSSPLGLQDSISSGLISSRLRDVDDPQYPCIQFTAPISKGSSGGALLNEYGLVVGVTTLKMSSDWDTIEALGFAIPTATVKTIVDDLIAHGYVTGRPTIGVTVCTISALPKDEGDDKPIEGLYVLSVEEASDAWKQGLREGDILLRANGQMLLEIEDLNDQKTGLQAGDTISLTVWRDGETFEVDVALVEQYLLES